MEANPLTERRRYKALWHKQPTLPRLLLVHLERQLLHLKATSTKG